MMGIVDTPASVAISMGVSFISISVKTVIHPDKFIDSFINSFTTNDFNISPVSLDQIYFLLQKK